MGAMGHSNHWRIYTMSDTFFQVPPNSTGAKIDAEEVTVGANIVQRQRLQIAGAASGDIVEVAVADPTSAQHGLVVRDVNAAAILAALNAILAKLP